MDIDDDLSNREVDELESHRKQMEFNRLSKAVYGSNVAGAGVNVADSEDLSLEDDNEDM
jgi:adenylate kinase